MFSISECLCVRVRDDVMCDRVATLCEELGRERVRDDNLYVYGGKKWYMRTWEVGVSRERARAVRGCRDLEERFGVSV